MMLALTSARWASTCGGPPMKRRTSASASIARMASTSSSVRARSLRRGVASMCMVATGRSPLISLGRSPTRPMAWRTKKRRSGGTRLTAASPTSRTQPDRLDVVGEQPVQEIGRGDHGEVVGPAPLRIALERIAAADVEAEPLAVDQDLDQGRDVAHAEIVALARDGMDAVRGIAHQHQARVDVALGMDQAERIPPARAGRFDVAEIVAEAAGELGLEARRVELEQALAPGRRARSRRSTSDARRSRRRASAGWRRGRRARTSPARRRDAAARGAPPARWRSGRTTRHGRRCRHPRAWCRSGPRPRRPGASRCAGRSSARARRGRDRAWSRRLVGRHQLDMRAGLPAGAAGLRAKSGSRRSSPSAPALVFVSAASR